MSKGKKELMKEVVKTIEKADKKQKNGKEIIIGIAEKKEIEAFIDEVVADPKWLKKNPERKNVVKDILRIGKTVYYNKPAEGVYFKFLEDSYYDKLLAVVKQQFEVGADATEEEIKKSNESPIEPKADLPAGAKKIKAVDPYLINKGMQRGYKMYENDKLLDTKETGSVEVFLKSLYDAVGKDYNEDISIRLSPKIDGIAFVAKTDSDGKIVDSSLKGTDEDNMAISVEGFKGRKICDKEGVFQFEAIVPKSLIEKIEYETGTKFKRGKSNNNRGCSAGTMMRISNGDRSLLDFVRLYPITMSDEGKDVKDYSLKYHEFYDMIMNGPQNKKFKFYESEFLCGDLEWLMDNIVHYKHFIERDRFKLDYAVDGVVISAMDDEVINKVGRRNNANMFDFAFKFPSETVTVKIKDYYLSPGKKGRRSIKGIFNTVEIDGREFKEGSIETFQYNDRGLRIGDEFKLTLTGDAIPKLDRDSSHKTGNGTQVFFEKCNTCGTPFRENDGNFICHNPECKDNIIGKVQNALSVLGVDGVGRSVATKIVDEMKIKADCILSFLLPENTKILDNLGKNGGKIKTTINELKSNGIELNKLIEAIGIRSVGRETAIGIAKALGGVNEIIGKSKEDIADTLIKRRNKLGLTYSDRVANEWAEVFGSEEIQGAIKTISKVVSIKGAEDDEGLIKIGTTRVKVTDEMHEVAKKNGCKIVDGGKYDLLMVDSKSAEPSNKMLKAEKNGTPMIEKSEFLDKGFPAQLKKLLSA